MPSTVIPPDLYISVNGIKTRYWHMGERGKNIVLLHGGNGSVEFWLYNLPALAQHYRVYAFDMVGTGKSEYPDADYSLAYQAEFLGAFMDAVGVDAATLVGNSMGGAVALEMMRTHADSAKPTLRERVEKLVLVDSMGLGKEISLGIRLITLPAIVSMLQPGRWMIPAMMKSNFYDSTQLPSDWIELRYEIFAIPGRNRVILQMGRSNFTLAGVRSDVYQPILDSLAKIDRPTLIIWGDRDLIIPVQHAHIAAAKIPNSRLDIFPNCGHHPYLEYPDRFNQLLLDFLSE